MKRINASSTMSLIVVLACASFGVSSASAAEKLTTSSAPFALELCNSSSGSNEFCRFSDGTAHYVEAQAPIPAGTRFVIESISGRCAPGIREIGGVYQHNVIYYSFGGGGSVTESFNTSTLMYIDSNAPLGPNGWDAVVQSTGGPCRVILTGYVLPLPK